MHTIYYYCYYYLTKIVQQLFKSCPDIQCSWILKAMFKHRDDLLQSDVWKGFQNTGKYVTRKIYHMLRGDKPKVTWRKIFYGNLVRLRAKFILWMTCLDRLPTKDRLHRFGVVTDSKCVFCGLIETCDHLFFECATTKKVWADILRWISIMRIPGGWHSELQWICQLTNGKGRKISLQKIALAEVVYAIWTCRNKIIFQPNPGGTIRSRDVIDIILLRATSNRNLN